ncbi:protein FAM133-like [Pieris rapae]|uniref:protein FAM133-like n=1 Tax=Pieris rapae TaxID=64459 RepID=UPI001E27A27C|nr:protein FAM133-like [Pieris rapae]
MKKKFRDSSSSSSSSESTSSSREYALRSKKKQKRTKKRQVLTPVISYVTRNGDVVYQKKVKKDKAGDWLDLGKSKSRFEEESKEEIENIDSQEMTVRDLKRKFDLKSKKHKHRH